MQNFPDSFTGQQQGERVLYVVHPHHLALYIDVAKVLAIALMIAISSIFLAGLFPAFVMGGMLLALVVGVVGVLAVLSMEKMNLTYVTDRRIIRFTGATPFATNTRSLNWDDAVKVKTFAPNVFWKMFKIGNVVVHARSTFVHLHETPATRESTMTNDDLDLEHVYYYRDLGNYIDKILYLYKHSPEELKELRAFVPKPKGKRY